MPIGNLINEYSRPVQTKVVLKILFNPTQGGPLEDEYNSQVPIYTIDTEIHAPDTLKKNCVSILVNSGVLGSGYVGQGVTALPVVEQFPTQSEVSTSLLGIPRGERQQSLFSDVSSYGLNEEEWVFTTGYNYYFDPNDWQTKYAPKYQTNYKSAGGSESTTESTLIVSAFPVPYSYPYPPAFDKVGLYNPDLYARYQNFRCLGYILYNYYSSLASPPRPPRDFFHPINGIQNLSYTSDDDRWDWWTDTWIQGRIGETAGFTLPINSSGGTITLAGESVRNWPNISTVSADVKNYWAGLIVSAPSAQRLSLTLSTSNQPGYNEQGVASSSLISRRTFRYQPGRISAFTFGARASTNTQTNTVLEWGCENATDSYLFRVVGSEFYIRRKSTIPLEGNSLFPNINTPGVVSNQVFSNGQYIVDIPRSQFCFDSIDGNGPSGYQIDLTKVTMWKIEYSWYGAIGVNFLAYIPVGNGEARWVKLHRIVIENSLGKACLNDPNFNFIYRVVISNPYLVRSPQFVYKYGASYYIDGEDKGTRNAFSISSNKVLDSLRKRTIFGLQLKPFLSNRDGYRKENKKQILPTSLNVYSESDAIIDLGLQKAAPDFGYQATDKYTATPSGSRIYNSPIRKIILSSGAGIVSGTIEAVPYTISSQSSTTLITSDVNNFQVGDQIYLTKQDGSGGILANVTSLDSIDPTHKFVVDTLPSGYANGSCYIPFTSADIDSKLIDSNLYCIYVKSLDTTSALPSLNGYYSRVILRSQKDTIGNRDFPNIIADDLALFSTSSPRVIRFSQWAGTLVSNEVFTGSLVKIGWCRSIKTESTGQIKEFEIGILEGGKSTDSLFTNVLGFREQAYVGFDRDGNAVGEVTEINSGGYPLLAIALDSQLIGTSTPVGFEGVFSEMLVSISNPIPTSGIFNQDPNGYYVQTTTFIDPSSIGGQISADANGVNIATIISVSSFIDQNQITQYKIYIGSSNTLGYVVGSNITFYRKILTISPGPFPAFGGVLSKNKVISFNTSSLKIAIRMRDGCDINSLVYGAYDGVEYNIYKATFNTFSLPTYTQSFPPGYSPTDSISDFVDETGPIYAGVVDKNSTLPLRSPTSISKFFVKAGVDTEFDLRGIFGDDRLALTGTPYSRRNIGALFVQAKALNGGSGNIYATLNYEEQ